MAVIHLHIVDQSLSHLRTKFTLFANHFRNSGYPGNAGFGTSRFQLIRPIFLQHPPTALQGKILTRTTFLRPQLI